ncbi:MAG: S24/S26 family peptidase [Acidobacteria bacterium]|nr:S24/S26 family peptidase [Acidobacteriota bacterium]
MTATASNAEELRRLAALMRSSGGEIETTVHGRSMAPALPENTTVRIRLGEGACRQAGQIVVFVDEGCVVAHRVVGRRGDYLITQGDANLLVDAPVHARSILGLVTGFACEGGWKAPDAPLPQPLHRRAAGLLARALVRGLLTVSASLACRSVTAVWKLQSFYRGINSRRRGASAPGSPGDGPR